ncbi:unnamed protein product [Rhizophagus irregularis]|nr:unnamed protein product [Rhizophagus irregularis]
MEQFSLDIKTLMDFQKDVLKMVKSVNKPIINENVYKSEVETTPQKGKKAKRKAVYLLNNFFSKYGTCEFITVNAFLLFVWVG